MGVVGARVAPCAPPVAPHTPYIVCELSIAFPQVALYAESGLVPALVCAYSVPIKSLHCGLYRRRRRLPGPGRLVPSPAAGACSL